MGTWIAIALVIIIAVVILVGVRRLSIPRRENVEGLEDSAVAEAYDRITHWPQFRLLRQLFLRELKHYHPEGIVVDIGCGPGLLVAVLTKAFPNLCLIGVDIAENMVQQAAVNMASQGLSDRTSFRLGDIKELPFDENSINWLVSTLSLHHWTEPGQAFQEIYRVLRPGGQFLIFDLRRDSWRIFRWLLWFGQTFVVPAPIRTIGEPSGSLLAAYTPEEMNTFLSQTSFHTVSVKGGIAWMFLWGRKDDS